MTVGYVSIQPLNTYDSIYNFPTVRTNTWLSYFFVIFGVGLRFLLLSLSRYELWQLGKKMLEFIISYHSKKYL